MKHKTLKSMHGLHGHLSQNAAALAISLLELVRADGKHWVMTHDWESYY